MVRLFFVDCPNCGETFPAHYDELRHSGIELRCPTCAHRFLDSEAADLRE